MNRSAKPTWLSVLAGSLLAAGLLCLVWRLALFSHHDPLASLPDAPLGTRLHFAGVVTYVDEPGNRFWIEDETGAAPIPADTRAAKLTVGETVAVEAVKAASFQRAQGPGNAVLVEVKVSGSGAHIRLPQLMPVSLGRFPDSSKNGLQIQVSGVVRAAKLDRFGRAEIDIATNGREVPLMVAHPAADYTKWVNAEVRATGVPEEIRDPRTKVAYDTLWVPAGSGVQVERAAPTDSPLYSIRSLYIDAGARRGFRLRL